MLTYLLQQKSPHSLFLFLQGDCAKVSSINDKSDWKTVRKALSVVEFSETDIEVRQYGDSLHKDTGPDLIQFYAYYILLVIYQIFVSVCNAALVWNNCKCAPSGKHQVRSRCSRIRVSQRQGDTLGVEGDAKTNCQVHAIFRWKPGVDSVLHYCYYLFFSCCAVAGDSYSSVTTGLNPQED